MSERKPVITVLFDENALERIDQMAEKMGLTRSKVASNLLSAGLVIIDSFDKSGLLRLASWLEWVISEVKAHVTAVEKKDPEIKRATITVTIPLEEVEYLGELAKRFLNTRAKLAGNIILANLPSLEQLHKIGLIGAVRYFEQIKKKALKKSQGKVNEREIPVLE
jgi:hypothetical protein